MSDKVDKTLEAAQEFIGQDIQFGRLDQIFDLQRLMGPVIALKVLLEISINSVDPKERRLAASQLLQSAGEDPAKIADRLRASLFSELSLDEIEAIVQTGMTDPERAVERLKKVKKAADG